MKSRKNWSLGGRAPGAPAPPPLGSATGSGSKNTDGVQRGPKWAFDWEGA